MAWKRVGGIYVNDRTSTPFRQAMPWEASRSSDGLGIAGGGQIVYLLNYNLATFTRTGEAAAVDPRNNWAFYDLATPWKGTNVSRILGDGAVLLEGSRTNSNPYSQQLDGASWAGTATQAANTATAPDATSTADTMENTGTTFDTCRRYATGPTPAVQCAMSAYVKQKIGTVASIQVRNGGAVATSITLNGNWQRLENQGVSNGFAEIFNCSNGQGGTGLAADEHYWWGVQAENNATFASSPIRTTGAAATRGAENLSFASLPTHMRSGRWKIDIWPMHVDAAVDWSVVAIGAGATDEVSYDIVSGRFSVIQGSATKVQSNVITWAAGAKITLTFDAVAGSITVQGAASGNGTVTGTSWTWPSATSYIGSRSAGTNASFAVFGRPRTA